MKILALDTALNGCSVGVYNSESGTCISEQEAMVRGQAEWLVPMIQDVMRQADTDFAALDLIATTIGPGAFTGLRIGLSTAQGLGLALDKPVCGLITLDVLAAQFFASDTLDDDAVLGVLIETKRRDYYGRFYGADGVPVTEPQALEGEQIGEQAAGRAVTYIGDAAERFVAEGGAGDVRAGYELPDPHTIALMAMHDYEGDGSAMPQPLYLRGADVSRPKKAQREILGS